MGSKKKTHISTQSYNMAGDYKDRMIFSKTVVIGSVLRGEHDTRSLGDVITSNYLSGPGIALRNLDGWFNRNNYWNTTFQTKSFINTMTNVEEEALIPFLPVKPGETALINSAKLGIPTTEDIVFKYMLDAYPDFYQLNGMSEEDIEKDYNFTYVPSDDDNDLYPDTIRITYKKDEFTINVPKDNSEGEHIIVEYAPYKLVDAPTTIHDIIDFPDLIDWTLVNDDRIKTTSRKQTIIKYEEYADGSVVETDLSNNNETFDTYVGSMRYDKYDINGNLSAYEIRHYNEAVEEVVTTKNNNFVTDPEDDNPIISSVTVTTDKYREVIDNSLTRTIVDGATINTGNKIFIYKFGTGNPTIDKIITKTTSESKTFYPIIPFRVNRIAISNNYFNGIYKLNKQAYKRLTSSSYDDMIKQVNSSPGILDINTGFIQLGVALNTKDPSAKDYIFNYFTNFLRSDGAKPNEDSWLDQAILYSDSSYARAVISAQNKSSPFVNKPLPPLYIRTKFRYVRSVGVFSGLGIFIVNSYSGGKIGSKSGVYSNLKKGEFKVEELWSRPYSRTGWYAREYCRDQADRIVCRWGVDIVGNYNPYGGTPLGQRTRIYRITKQIEDDHYEFAEVYDVMHENIVKDGKSSTTFPFSYNDGGEESSCIIPLNRGIMRGMSLKNMTQFSIGVKHMTFTAWKVTKQKWYQTGLFKIVTVVVIIVISIYFPPAGAAAGGAGILGANAAIGAAIGLAGTAALVAGAAINAIAAMVVSAVLSKAATGIFGDKIGAIVGAVASVVVSGVASNMSNGASFAEAMNGLYRADNLISITKSVGTGYVGYMNAKTMDVLERTQKMLEEVENQIKDVETKMSEFTGNNAIIDPLYLTDVFGEFFEGETSQEFIDRTLMTGSDIAEATHNLINNFANINLTLNK